MSKLLLYVRNVRDDEADDVRTVLDAKRITFYEIPPSFWVFRPEGRLKHGFRGRQTHVGWLRAAAQRPRSGQNVAAKRADAAEMLVSILPSCSIVRTVYKWKMRNGCESSSEIRSGS